LTARERGISPRERLFAAVKSQAVDRVPYALWQHSTVHERTVERFTRFTLDFHHRYRPDLLKVMYDEQYDLPVDRHHLRDARDWRLLEEFEAHTGAFGRQLECLARIRAAVGPEVPVVQTIYSPFHVAHKVAGRRILEDWRGDPEAVSGALATIAANYRRFAECCLREAGVDGFFFAPIGCEASFMPESQYIEMIRPSDLAVLEALRQAPLLILHIHGEREVMFDLLAAYPGDVLSWEDRVAGPSLAEVRRANPRCLMGGIDHLAARTCAAEELVRQGREAIAQAGGSNGGFILAPGCTFPAGTPEANLRSLGQAVESA
jgi:uroporphyrinogen decarboxylase